jgi:hypothetical protein
MAAKSRYLSNQVLNAVLVATTYTSPLAVYTALNTTASTPTTPGTEDSDGHYARIATTFSPSTLGTTANSGALAFYGAGRQAGSATIVEAAIYDQLAGGNELYYGSLAVPKTVSVGDTLSFSIGALSVAES